MSRCTLYRWDCQDLTDFAIWAGSSLAVIALYTIPLYYAWN